jgi:hypothetical protein
MGFPKYDAADAYIAFGKNKQAAANFLLTEKMNNYEN